MCVCVCVWTAVLVREREPRKNEERDACMSKIRGCVCERLKEIMSSTAGGKYAQCACVCV